MRGGVQGLCSACAAMCGDTTIAAKRHHNANAPTPTTVSALYTHTHTHTHTHTQRQYPHVRGCALTWDSSSPIRTAPCCPQRWQSQLHNAGPERSALVGATNSLPDTDARPHTGPSMLEC